MGCFFEPSLVTESRRPLLDTDLGSWSLSCDITNKVVSGEISTCVHVEIMSHKNYLRCFEEDGG